ncbi:uncharacterized protein [Pyxicephalus adspersus]|uniref:uncharacterized protein n=1 Tax=Pyxicephalus adspersus TaxID=30357 RepID=UPI003B5CDB97
MSSLCPVLCNTKQDKEDKKNCDIDLIAKNVHFKDSVKTQTEKTQTHNSVIEENTFRSTQCDLQCMIELESRIDWKGIFGMQKEKAEEMAEIQKPLRRLREPSGLRIFPDMEITIGNPHYVCVVQNVNSFVHAGASIEDKERINQSFEKEVISDFQKTSFVSEIVNEKTFSMCQDWNKAPVNSPELPSYSVSLSESDHSDEKQTTKNQAKSEVTKDYKLTGAKTGHNLSHTKIMSKKLGSTRKHLVVGKQSVRRMNKFSQSEKNIKVVLGLLGEIPLCKSKRISKRLDRAILHLRKAHKRVQKSLQLVAKSGRKCNTTDTTTQVSENYGQEYHNIEKQNAFKIIRHSGKKVVPNEKQTEGREAECSGEHMLQIPNFLKVAAKKHRQKCSPDDGKSLNMTTEVASDLSARDSLLAETSSSSSLPKKLPPSPPSRSDVVTIESSSASGKQRQKSSLDDGKSLNMTTQVVNGLSARDSLLAETSGSVVATGSSSNSPSFGILDEENAVPVTYLLKSTSEKKEISSEICKKRNARIGKKILQANKYNSYQSRNKTYKKTDAVCETVQHKRKKIKQSKFTTAKNTEVSKLLLGKLSRILENASGTHSLKRLKDFLSLCNKMLPVFIKSFERKQESSWRDVIVDRKSLFSHQLKTSFRSTLQPQAIESFLELQMMIETTQFIENRICFIEGRPTFRSLLWYDGSLYRELLSGETGYQQQSPFYTAFQKKINGSAVTTLENLCSRLSEFLKEIDDKNSSFYVYLKYKRELKECEDVLKHDCDYSAFSLSIPFSCGAHLGNTVDDLVALQKCTLDIIGRFMQLPKVEPGKKEHALCLLEMISAKIDFLKTSVSLSMNMSLFGIQHLLFDAAKMMVLNENKSLHKDKKIVLTKDITGQINISALSKLYEVFCVPGKEAWVAYDKDELLNENLNSHNNHKDKFLVGRIIDEARHADICLLQQMILKCQNHLDSKIKNFQIFQECDIQKTLIKDSNVKELTQRKDLVTTLLKSEAVELYIELTMTYETLHFLKCVMASQKKEKTKRGILWYDASLLPDLVQIQKRLAFLLKGDTMPRAIDTIERRIRDIKSELEVIGNCPDSVNYSYAFQIMTRELSELSELKKLVLKSSPALDGYIHFSPCVVSVHYGNLSPELDYNYSQFSDFLEILMSSPKKDLGKMAHTMKIMKTIELAKALIEKNSNSPLDLFTCQILQNRIKSDCIINKAPNGGKTSIHSPRKRKCVSLETLSPKKKVMKICEKSPGKQRKEKNVSPSSMKEMMKVLQKNEAQSPVKKHCMKSLVTSEVKAFLSSSPKCRKQVTSASVGNGKCIQKNTETTLPPQFRSSPEGEVSMSCSRSPKLPPRSQLSTSKFCSTSNSKNDQNQTNIHLESLAATRSDQTSAGKIHDESSTEKETSTEKESIYTKVLESENATVLDKSLSDTRPLEQKDCLENTADEEKLNTNPQSGQQTQTNHNGCNKKPLLSLASLYPQYPGLSNSWQHSSYLWYQGGASTSQAFPGVSFDAQNTNPYNQTSAFPMLAPYSNQPYSNFMGQIQPQGYATSSPFGATMPYNYCASSSASNQNGVPIPYNYSSTVRADWSWNSWK